MDGNVKLNGWIGVVGVGMIIGIDLVESIDKRLMFGLVSMPNR